MSIPPRNPSEGVKPTERERDELIGFAKIHLRRHVDLNHFIESGQLPSSLDVGGGTFGQLRDARSAGFNRKLVGIYRPTEDEAASARAWHDFCDECGYPLGERCGADEDPTSGYPPPPLGQSDGSWAVLTWQAVRSALAAGQEPQQLDLLSALEQGRDRVAA